MTRLALRQLLKSAIFFVVMAVTANHCFADTAAERLIIYGGVGLISGMQSVSGQPCNAEDPATDFPWLARIRCDDRVKSITAAVRQTLQKAPIKLSRYPVVFTEDDLRKVENNLPKIPGVKLNALTHFTADDNSEKSGRALYLLTLVGTVELHVPYVMKGDKAVYHDNVLAGVSAVLLNVSKGSQTSGTVVHASTALAEKHLVGGAAADQKALAAAFADVYQRAAVQAVRTFNGSLGKGVICGDAFCDEREMVTQVLVADPSVRPLFGFPATMPQKAAFDPCLATPEPCETSQCRRFSALIAHGTTQALAQAGRPVTAPLGFSAWTATGERSAGIHFQLSDGGPEIGNYLVVRPGAFESTDGIRFRVRLREMLQKDLPVAGTDMAVQRAFRSFLSLDWGKAERTASAAGDVCRTAASGETPLVGGDPVATVIPTTLAREPFPASVVRGFQTTATINALAALGGKR